MASGAAWRDFVGDGRCGGIAIACGSSSTVLRFSNSAPARVMHGSGRPHKSTAELAAEEVQPHQVRGSADTHQQVYAHRNQALRPATKTQQHLIRDTQTSSHHAWACASTASCAIWPAHTRTGHALATAATRMRTSDCEHEACDIRGVCSHYLGRLIPQLDQMVFWMRGRRACVQRRAAHDTAVAVVSVCNELHLQRLPT